MLSLLFIMLLQSQPASSQSALPDPYAVPADERIRWQRRLADVGEGRNGRELYERAHAVLVEPNDEKHESAIGAQSAPWIRANFRSKLPFNLDWPPDHTNGITAWLRLNEPAIRLIQQAADCPRAVTIPPESPPEVEPEGPEFPGVCWTQAQLISMTIASSARDGRWAAAYDDAVRLYRLAGHMRQTTMKWNPLDEMIEHIGYQTLVVLLERHPPADFDALRRGLRDAWGMKTLSEAELRFLDALGSAAATEFDHAWATNPDDAEGHSETLRALLESIRFFEEGEAPFESVDAYREALLKSSREASYRAAREFYDAWNAAWSRPPREIAGQFERVCSELRSVALRDPYTRLWVSTNIDTLVRPILDRAVQLTERRAILTLLAIHEWRRRHDEWPVALDGLNLGTDGVDPFSESSLVYRRSADGRSFVLYSVGPNLTDDGGAAPSKRRPIIEKQDGDILLWPLRAPEFEAAP